MKEKLDTLTFVLLLSVVILASVNKWAVVGLAWKETVFLARAMNVSSPYLERVLFL